MMYIIAIAWIYVVSMMAITEPSVMAGIMTFLIYCVMPLGLVWLIAIHIKRQFVNPNDNQNQQNRVEKKEKNSSKGGEKKE